MSVIDFNQFIPLYVRDEDDIRIDFDIDANAGLTPSNSEWVDTRQGGFFHMTTQPFVIEAARIHDQIATLPAVAFIEFAYGIYLDYHARRLNTERHAATYAIGEVLFTGAIGTIVPTGEEVGTETLDPNQQSIIFKTTQTVQINGPIDIPTSPAGVVNTGGTLGPGDRYYVITAYDAAGETPASGEVHAIITSGGDKQALLTWDAVDNAIGYYVYEGSTTGGENQRYQVTAPSLIDTGSLVWEASGPPPVFNTTGGKIYAPIQAAQPGASGNVPAEALNQMVTYNPGIAAVINVGPCSDGEDTESDPALQQRLLQIDQGDGPGRSVDYVRWGMEIAGVGRVQCLPLYNGPGTVGVVLMDSSGNPVSADVIAAAQLDLDPYPGQGGGTAPIDHIVTVYTPQMVPIPVTAVLTFRPGYSLDGTGSTVALRPLIVAALNEYLNNVMVGESIPVDKIKAVIYSVVGVLNVNLTAPSADTTINLSPAPPQKAVLGAVALS